MNVEIVPCQMKVDKRVKNRACSASTTKENLFKIGCKKSSQPIFFVAPLIELLSLSLHRYCTSTFNSPMKRDRNADGWLWI